MPRLFVTRVLGRLISDALRERRNARFLGELAVRAGVTRLRSSIAPSAPSPSSTSPTSRPATAGESRVEVTEPLPGYGLLSAAQVIELIETLDDAARSRVLAYETVTKARRSVLQRLAP